MSGLPGVWLWKPVGGWQNTGGLGLWPSPMAINNSGQVAAYNLSTDETHNEGLFYDPTSGWRLIDGFGNNGVVPIGMNDNGLVVGNSWLGSFTWTEADGPTILPALFRVTAVNNSGVVVGAAGFEASPISSAAKWDATNGLTLLHEGASAS